ncbi:hypothetical protein NGB36_30125 [Streptomyces sp. RB6PN25]|uniref:Integral membrane protein n=1 Tax=Streptomyces humicola TaxID=2953240 RepID=A0ABT1Q473_9ACTN|nr:hypothetical protein [Streptomyces humicola]MCQ4084718.1 hypothetical protein [Streptomyces humicola]
MPAHTAGKLPRLHREQQRGERHRRSAWAIPVVLGVVYGTYALWLDSNSPQPTPTAALLGLIAAIVMGALCYAVGRAQPRMSAETRGIVYGVLFGVGIGFLVSLTHDSVLKCAAIALASGAGMGICAFYISYGGREHQKGVEPSQPGKSVERAEGAGHATREVDETRRAH